MVLCDSMLITRGEHTAGQASVPALARDEFRRGAIAGRETRPLYADIPLAQQKFWKVSRNFAYQDIEKQPWFLGFPGIPKGRTLRCIT